MLEVALQSVPHADPPTGVVIRELGAALVGEIQMLIEDPGVPHTGPERLSVAAPVVLE